MNFFKEIFKQTNKRIPQESIDEWIVEGSEEEVLDEFLDYESNVIRRYRSTPTEDVLEKRAKSESKKLGGGICETVFVELKDDGAGVFKPKENDEDNKYKKERAAYLADRFLGFELVPPTVIREIDGRIGSVQRFVHNAEIGYMIIQKISDGLSDQEKIKINFFDFLIQNLDRHQGNFLVKNNKVIAIDHGLSFYDMFCPFYPCFKVEAVQIPESIRDKILKLNNSENMKSVLRNLLLEILPTTTVDGFFARLERLAQLVEDVAWLYDVSYLNKINI